MQPCKEINWVFKLAVVLFSVFSLKVESEGTVTSFSIIVCFKLGTVIQVPIIIVAPKAPQKNGSITVFPKTAPLDFCFLLSSLKAL